MTNKTLQTLIEDVAARLGCSAPQVSLSFKDYGAEGGWGWCCEVPKGHNRPRFQGYGDTPTTAVSDLFRSDSYRRWKDPDGFEREQDNARLQANFDQMLADGDITTEQHKSLVEITNVKLEPLAALIDRL